MGLGAYPVPQALRELDNDPSDLELFQEMWPEICAEETTYDAYAAAPYLMDFAARLDTADADDYLIVAGLIATYASEVPSDLEPAFKNAMQRGLELTLQRLQKCKTNEDLRYLLASVAAMRGRTDLASVLQDLGAIQEPARRAELACLPPICGRRWTGPDRPGLSPPAVLHVGSALRVCRTSGSHGF